MTGEQTQNETSLDCRPYVELKRCVLRPPQYRWARYITTHIFGMDTGDEVEHSLVHCMLIKLIPDYYIGQSLCTNLKVVTSRIMKTLGALHSDYRQFKSRFVVGEKDYVKVMRDDIKEVQAMMRGLDFLISE